MSDEKSLVPIEEAPVTMQTLNTMVSQQLLPSRYMNQPQQAAIAILVGREIGLHPLAAINDLYLVNGSVSMLARTMSALIHQAGHLIKSKVTTTKATLECYRWHAQSGQLIKVGTVEFGVEDAKKAKLEGKDTYKQYPKAMYANRALSMAARIHYADVFTGLGHIPEELGVSDGIEDVPSVVEESPEGLSAEAVADILEGEIVEDES